MRPCRDPLPPAKRSKRLDEATEKLNQGLLSLNTLQKRMMAYVESHADEDLQLVQGGVTQRCTLTPLRVRFAVAHCRRRRHRIHVLSSFAPTPQP